MIPISNTMSYNGKEHLLEFKGIFDRNINDYMKENGIHYEVKKAKFVIDTLEEDTYKIISLINYVNFLDKLDRKEKELDILRDTQEYLQKTIESYAKSNSKKDSKIIEGIVVDNKKYYKGMEYKKIYNKRDLEKISDNKQIIKRLLQNTGGIN